MWAFVLSERKPAKARLKEIQLQVLGTTSLKLVADEDAG
jgi:hypothetical protein